VNGDYLRLIQVFGNLLDDVSSHTPRGGSISLKVVVFDDSLTVTVRDNGIGIAPEVLPGSFDLFVQDAQPLPVHNGGFGVGLAVVRDLVEAHAGTVVGKSAGRDCGSEFVVTLPLADFHVASQVS
jgi:signal transduction histidine kinase